MGLFDRFLHKDDRTEEENQAVDKPDWTEALKKSEVFSKMEPDRIAEICAGMEPVKVKKGALVVKQGESADYYYVLASKSKASMDAARVVIFSGIPAVFARSSSSARKGL